MIKLFPMNMILVFTKAIYSFAKENLFGDTLGLFFTGSSTQPSDTNIVEAWFTNDKIISNEYDPRYLQKQYIPTRYG